MALKFFGKVVNKLESIKHTNNKKAYDTAVKIGKRAVELCPVDSGRLASSISVSLNAPEFNDGSDLNMEAHIEPYRKVKGNLKMFVTSGVDYSGLIEHGGYSNPGLPHWYHKPLGIVVRVTEKGYYIIRTTDEGYSNRAERGVIKEAFEQIKKEK
jgi:hypothetical protein